jgi:restriction endonuclease S subunit
MRKQLKTLADIRFGYQFRGKVEADPTGNVRVIQIKDIEAQRKIHLDGLVSVNLDRPDPYLTRYGDVLFLARGHRHYAVVVPETLPNIIATGYFFILRPDIYTVLSEYLEWAINQSDFQQSLRPFVKGTHMPIVSKADFEELEIFVPPLEMQKRIVALSSMLDGERRLAEEIQKRREILINAVCGKLMRRESEPEDQ